MVGVLHVYPTSVGGGDGGGGGGGEINESHTQVHSKEKNQELTE